MNNDLFSIAMTEIVDVSDEQDPRRETMIALVADKQDHWQDKKSPHKSACAS